MFQPKRFVRVRYTEGGHARVFYGFSANTLQDERVTKECLELLKERNDLAVHEVCVVTMGYGSLNEDMTLEHKEVPVESNGDGK